MQSRLLSSPQSILVCDRVVGTCTTFPTYNYIVVMFKEEEAKLIPCPELVKNLPGVQLVVRRTTSWRPPVVPLEIYKSPTLVAGLEWMNSHHATEKLPRRRLGRRGCERPPLLFSPDQKASCKGFRTQFDSSELERRNLWCLRCQETWVGETCYGLNSTKMNLEEYNITAARICCYVEYDWSHQFRIESREMLLCGCMDGKPLKWGFACCTTPPLFGHPWICICASNAYEALM